MHAALAGELGAHFFSIICVREHLRLSSCSMQPDSMLMSCSSMLGIPPTKPVYQAILYFY